MQAEVTSYWEWQQRYSNEQSCLQVLIQLRWPNGFKCEHFWNAKGWLLQTHHEYECAGCRHHTSITAGILFHNTNLPLVKWFWCIYWMSTDKCSISAFRLTKLVGVSRIIAHRMLRKLRVAMGYQYRLCRLEDTVELDDAFLGGKRGRGADGKMAMLVACEHNNGRPGFFVMKAIGRVDQNTVKAFAQQAIAPVQTLRTDAFAALTVLAEDHRHVAKVTPPEWVDVWLPWVHIVISNFKRYLLGIYHGISGCYTLEYHDEFCYRLNRRFQESKIPNRLLKLCATHPLILLQPVGCY